MTPHPTTPLPRLLALSGSLRRGSHSTALMQALGPFLADRAVFEPMTLHEVPLYNADLEVEALPDGVRRLKQAIADADGLVVCSPEYNYGIPGVLKNALDWASRPAFKSPLKGKPALIITCSPGAFGGVRAQGAIRDVLAGVLARPLVRPQVAIAGIDTKLRDGDLADEKTRQLLESALGDLLAEIARLSPKA